MELFDPHTRVASLILNNYLLLPVLNRFGIQLGCGDKSVEQICKEKEINQAFFLNIINTYTHPNYFPASELLSYSPKLIIEYLGKSHDYYTNYSLVKIEKSLQVLLDGVDKTSTGLKTIFLFYSKYKAEVISHIREEEETIFPYVEALLNRFENKEIPFPAHFKNYSINQYATDHGDVESKLNDLKSLVIKYLEPTYDENDGIDFLNKLFRFERDINDHQRIEDIILIPKIVELEKQVLHG